MAETKHNFIGPNRRKSFIKDDFEFNTKSKEKLVMEDLIAENFVLLTKIGNGASAYKILSYSLKENIEVIIKSE